jgi:hypothetical protein
MLQRPNRVQAVRERFNCCWLGYTALQNHVHQGIEWTGDISMKMYSIVQGAFGGVVVFERDISAVRQAMRACCGHRRFLQKEEALEDQCLCLS